MLDINWNDRRGLIQHIGDMSQAGGLRKYRLSDGKADGVEAVDIRTGNGLCVTVLPGRGMDIAWAEYRGVPFAYMAKSGVVASAYHEPEGMGFLRSFFGGLLTTCGLNNVGGPSTQEHPVVGKIEHGLHGRISHIPATEVGTTQGWSDKGYGLEVQGSMTEAFQASSSLRLTRSIKARLGDNAIHICDVIENQGMKPEPLMLLYHINLGFPLLQAGSMVYLNSLHVESASDYSREHEEAWRVMPAPKIDEPEHLYFHKPAVTEDGWTGAALFNQKLGWGVAVSWEGNKLPYMSQWKMPSATDYAMGIEPGNCLPVGREKMQQRAPLEMIGPGESKTYSMSISILENPGQLGKFRAWIGV